MINSARLRAGKTRLKASEGLAAAVSVIFSAIYLSRCSEPEWVAAEPTPTPQGVALTLKCESGSRCWMRLTALLITWKFPDGIPALPVEAMALNRAHPQKHATSAEAVDRLKPFNVRLLANLCRSAPVENARARGKLFKSSAQNAEGEVKFSRLIKLR